MKVSELTGAKLDYWVVRMAFMGGILVTDNYKHCFVHGKLYSPSTDWADGGPIIEREKMVVEPVMIDGTWVAYSRVCNGLGETLLLAAMRCFVASKFGEEVPDDPTK